MNPEFRRNLWLELTTRRMAGMAGALALIFFAASLSHTLRDVATLFYYLIVVVWGSRNAALSVVGEIRSRTWDGQRLSSLSAGQMMWGKLFGATAFTWFGGAICLVVILTETVAVGGAAEAAVQLAYFLTIGVIAQSAALLASLVSVIRERVHSRLDVFFYQLAGLFAALVANWLWSVGGPASVVAGVYLNLTHFGWWGIQTVWAVFLLLSLAAFAGWLLIGCWRTMRVELMQRNGPWVWIGFLVFVGIYVAGFDGILIDGDTAHIGSNMMRWLYAGAAFALLGYVMAFLEPKDRVLYRWMAGRIAAGRIGAALFALQGWTMAWFAACLCGVVLIVLSGLKSDFSGQMQIAAALGFFTRDLALVVLAGMMARRYGDLAGLTILAALYVLLPMILEGMQLSGALVLLTPRAMSPAWISPLVAWGEAILAIVFAAMSVGLREKTAE